MEISGLVNYETSFPLDIVHFSTDESVGITMQIRSAGSDEAKKVLRSQTDKNIIRNRKGKTPTSKQLEKDELEKAASYVASWDWGENTYKGSVPKLSMEKAIEIFKAEGWLFGQVVEAANKIENFTTASPKKSAKK